MGLISPEDLLAGFERGELQMHYQLIVDPVTMRPHGVEALLRWLHPLRGLLRAGEFLPQMCGAIGTAMVKTAVTRFALVETIGQAGVWRSNGYDVPISINVAPSAFCDDWVVTLIADLLARDQIPADMVTIEVTEQVERAEPDLRDAFDELSKMGVRLSLDDFGTGAAGLDRLHSLPFDEIKIDRRFVSNVCTHTKDRSIVEFSCSLANSLGMTAVAEGVEDRRVLRALAALGTPLVQGNLFNEPVPADDIPVLIGGLATLDLRSTQVVKRREDVGKLLTLGRKIRRPALA
jgi:EAL domain-containing protein (putative c-di-GMP-specific phosphodiesterase class I)